VVHQIGIHHLWLSNLIPDKHVCCCNIRRMCETIHLRLAHIRP